MKKTRQLLEELFEAEKEKLEPRYDPEHYKRMGFSDEEAHEQVRRARNPHHSLKTVQRNRGYGSDEPQQEANFHSPDERAVLDRAIRKSGASRMDKLRQRRPDLMPRAKATLMALSPTKPPIQ